MAKQQKYLPFSIDAILGIQQQHHHHHQQQQQRIIDSQKQLIQTKKESLNDCESYHYDCDEDEDKDKDKEKEKEKEKEKGREKEKRKIRKHNKQQQQQQNVCDISPQNSPILIFSNTNLNSPSNSSMNASLVHSPISPFGNGDPTAAPTTAEAVAAAAALNSAFLQHQNLISGLPSPITNHSSDLIITNTNTAMNSLNETIISQNDFQYQHLHFINSHHHNQSNEFNQSLPGGHHLISLAHDQTINQNNNNNSNSNSLNNLNNGQNQLNNNNGDRQ